MINRKEFEESLNSPIEYWGKLSALEVEKYMGTETARMVNFQQNNIHHCYDLFLHTLHVVDYLKNQPEKLLKVAAFFHDIGKTYVAREKNGGLVFYGHADKSAEVSESILKKLGYSNEEIQEIEFYVLHHDDFISWVLPEEEYNRNNPYLVPITKQNIQIHLNKMKKTTPILQCGHGLKLWKNLLLLCKADISAQADKVVKDKVVVDTKEQKLKKIERIEQEMKGESI